MTDINIQNTLFEIPKDGYLAFDALSMKQLITDNLNKTGVFTDQNYEASYLSNVINIIAYSYSALMYYLNKTSTETLFTEAQIYENMNRIVKLLGYNPVGFQTSLLSFVLNAVNLTKGIYVIPRYSYFVKNGISYSFNEDIFFNKTLDNVFEELTDISQSKVLYQGRFYEHPPYTAVGIDNETLTLTVDTNVLVDHFNINVYRYDKKNNTWEQWAPTENLFLEQPDSKKYQIRLNPRENYEIQFGNNTNGAKLNEGDIIGIYYLQSDGTDGEISERQFDKATFVPFFTQQFNQIFTDTTNSIATKINSTNTLQIFNVSPSTRSKNGETPDQIRQSAPALFKSQYRLVTLDDYKFYILNNYTNFIHDVTVVNNFDYISNRLKYYYDLGLENPDQLGAPLYSQINFSDSCNFNNIYITVVPRIPASLTGPIPTLTLAQKQIIIDGLSTRKTLTSDIVILDPVYIATSLGLPSSPTQVAENLEQDTENTFLYVTKTQGNKRPDDDIKADIVNLFKQTFKQENLNLGKKISLVTLRSQLLAIKGIQEIETYNQQTQAKVSGLVFYEYDPIYPTRVTISTTELVVTNFQFIYFTDIENFANKILFTPVTNIYKRPNF